MTLSVRTGHRSDYDAVCAMHERCSALTRARRYHTGMRQLTRDSWERMSAPDAGSTLVATAPSAPGRVVAVGHLLYEHAPNLAELAVLVEDSWQSHGLGGILSRRLYGYAHFMRVHTIVAYVSADNVRARRMIQRLARHPGGNAPAVRLVSDSALLDAAMAP